MALLGGALIVAIIVAAYVAYESKTSLLDTAWRFFKRIWQTGAVTLYAVLAVVLILSMYPPFMLLGAAMLFVLAVAFFAEDGPDQIKSRLPFP